MEEKLFNIEDFDLFIQYANKTNYEAPDGQTKLRCIYDKLGKILEGLKKKYGYHTDIKRNPLMQAGPSTMKYAEYHWSRVYPVDLNLYEECLNKVFVVVGTTSDGVNIHIDSYASKGYICNNVCKAIKAETWLEISPEEASTYSCEEFVDKINKYILDNWMEFNLFAKEFGIQESIKILINMEINKIIEVLYSNKNLILTGAPGTGKTYLAKKMAQSIGAEWKLVQFHPSYDYTDFVEGLRPVTMNNSIGFERKDGVFKEFCKRALKISIEDAYNILIDDIKSQKVSTIVLKSGKESAPLFVNKFNNICWSSPTEENNKSSNVITLDRIKKLYEHYGTLEKINNMTNISDDIRGIIGGCNATYYWGVLHKLLSRPYIFIVDEINRGEISKIFGELFFSIDPGYRGVNGRVDTQYQNLVPAGDIFENGFYVPENVYIIGTMNDIDRSVESMDFAMRRRFAWKEISVEYRQSMLDDEGAWGGNKPTQEIIDEIKIRMNNLNACIIDMYGDEELSPKDKIGLTKAYQIGAAYFLKYGMYGNFDELWTNHLEGLLYDYLRGTTNIETKIERLHKAYNDNVAP